MKMAVQTRTMTMNGTAAPTKGARTRLCGYPMIRTLTLAASALTSLTALAFAEDQAPATETAATRLAQAAPNAQPPTAPARGWLGVRIEDVTPEIMDGEGIQSLMGAYVVAALPGSPAANALQQGDIVLSVDNHDVSGAKEFAAAIQRSAPGTEVNMRIWRNHATSEVKVKLGVLPATAPSVR
jgi:S1-C subfamily serine protease